MVATRSAPRRHLGRMMPRSSRVSSMVPRMIGPKRTSPLSVVAVEVVELDRYVLYEMKTLCRCQRMKP